MAKPAAVFLRVQLLRGELDPVPYRSAMQGLISAIQTDPRVAPVAAGLDEQRLLGVWGQT